MGELALNMKRISDLRERFTERHDLLSGMFFSLTISALFEVAVDAKNAGGSLNLHI